MLLEGPRKGEIGLVKQSGQRFVQLLEIRNGLVKRARTVYEILY